ncbi:hypothetical protein ACFQ6N_01330 [Kitasatospora sp. NPDC056446]|uniref:hypothetical protein n=1 Tax=Kitasatospora sp. NPDC056446 TaxID=3345819 RepID=UPI0036CD498E
MSVGSRTSMLLKRIGHTRRQLLAASCSAPSQACEPTTDDPHGAEPATDRRLQHRSRAALALVHPAPWNRGPR